MLKRLNLVFFLLLFASGVYGIDNKSAYDPKIQKTVVFVVDNEGMATSTVSGYKFVYRGNY